MKNSKLVYSTDQGRIRQDSTPKPSTPTGDGIVRIQRETKGRKGKGVSLVTGIPEDQQKTIGKRLKQRLGVGGAVKNGVIEVQSDQRDVIKQALESEGFTVKIAGG